MVKWVLQHFGFEWALILVLLLALGYTWRGYLPHWVVESSDAVDGEVKDLIEEQTEHIDSHIDEVSDRIDTVETKAKRRDERIKEWARDEFASSGAVEQLRSEVGEFRSDMSSTLSQIQRQITELASSLIKDHS